MHFYNFMSLPISRAAVPPPSLLLLSLCRVVLFLLFLGNVPSLCHSVGDPPGDLRLSLRSLLAAIPATFSLKVSNVQKQDGSSALTEANIREASRVYAQQSVAELEPMSQRLCDVFESFWFFDLTETLLAKANYGKIGVELQDMTRLEAIVRACGTETHYHGLALALIEFITKAKEGNAASLKECEAKLRSIPNKMFALLLFDRLYGVFEQQIGEIIDQKNYAPEDANRVEFALKWLKQMRKEISTRYEANEAELKHLLERNSKDLEGLIDRTESDRMETREQLRRKFTRRVERMRDSSARVEEANWHIGQLEAVNRSHREKSERFGAAIRNGVKIGQLVNEMGGTGDLVVKLVRAQVKLSLMMPADDGTHDARANASSSSSSFPSSSSSSATDHLHHPLVLSEFLQQNVIVAERNGGVRFDAREALCDFLTHYGYSNLDRELAKIGTNQSKSSYGGRSLMRTLRLIRPNLEVQMGRIWEYGNRLNNFGPTFGETVAKIEQMGAFALYLGLYTSLLEQHLWGWDEKRKKAIPILYRPFMCPEEYIGHWLDQMCGCLLGKVQRAKRELGKMLPGDREKLRQMEGQSDNKSWAPNGNANRRSLAIHEKKSSRKKVGNYLLKIGKNLENKLHKKFAREEPSLGQNNDEIGGECATMALARLRGKTDGTPPNEQQIGKAIALNEEVAQLIGRWHKNGDRSDSDRTNAIS